MKATSIKQHLFDRYGGFADRRIKKLEKSNLFIVDDRSDRDYDARGHLFLWFCTIFARVKGNGTVDVELGGDVPTSKTIEKWVEGDNGSWRESPPGLVIPIVRGDEDRLEELAQLIANIVRPGARYEVKSYKYVCPRTAGTLRKLAAVLRSVPE